MGNYFKSIDVEVYPCSYRGEDNDKKQINPKARMLTEDGITHIAGTEGLAQNYVVNYSATKNYLEIVLAGYYFKIKNLDDYSLSNCYLNIITKDIESSGEMQRILLSFSSTAPGILDSDGNFLGLSYSAASEGNTSLKVFDNDGNIMNSAYLPDYDSTHGTFKLHGNSTTGNRSSAFGTNTKTNRANQFVVGENNKVSESALFIVGDGDTSEHNSFETGGGNTSINESVNISDDLNVAGNVTVSKDMTINGDEKVEGDVTVGKALEVAGITSLSDGLNIGKTDDEFTVTISKDGHTKIADIAEFTDDEINLKKPVIITSDAEVIGNIKASGNGKILTITSESINNESNLSINNIIITKTGCITADGNITAKGTLTAKKTLTVEGTGDSSFTGAITANSGKTDTANNENNHVAILSDLLDLIYPVGSIYTVDAKTYDKDHQENSLVCPIATKLGGAWVLIEDTFLHCESQKVGIGGAYKGGSDAAYLVNHSHAYKDNSYETVSTKAKRNGKDSDNDLVGTIFLPSGEYDKNTYGIMNNSKGDGVNNLVPGQTDYSKWVTRQTSSSGDNTQKWNGIITFRDGKHDICKNPYSSFIFSRVLYEVDLWGSAYAASPITIDARHEHELPSIETSGTTYSTDTKANMPAYQKVYAWVRTE